MVNPRYIKQLRNLRGKEFFKSVKLTQGSRAEGTEIPEAAILEPSKRLPDQEMPFMRGDRVQIRSGPDKGKVGYIIDRYPNLGNAFYVAGVGTLKLINPVENKALGDPDQYEPVVDNYKVFDYEDLRLVSKIKNENGKDEDVVIHSLALGPEEYDPLSNTHIRRRFAKHDPHLVIPWPTEKVKAVEGAETTNATYADLRTHFVPSALESPIPIGAVDQITNPNNRFKRGRYAPKITAAQLARSQPPTMPLPPKTRKLLADLEAMPKPAPVEFTPEMAEFIEAEVKKGLARRATKEAEALKTYQ